jgi:polyisoprenoid-binding protein YceI
MIKHIVFLATFLCMTMSILAQQQYKPQGDSSSIQFKIKNFGIAVSGTLKGLKGTIQFDPQKPGVCSFSVSVDAATVNTGIEMRDNHLKQDDYLSVVQYPLFSFTSTKVTASTKEGYLYVFGNLTIKDVTKPISFPFQVLPGGKGYVFTGSFSINRKDFGVGGSSISMNDMVNIELKVLALPVQ